MRFISKEIKNHFLIHYAKKKIKLKEKQLLKNNPWIKVKHLSNIVKSHCSVLLETLFSTEYSFSFRENKFILDKIIDYSFDKGSSFLGTNTDMKSIKPLLQVNSYIMFEELIKGLISNKSNKTISFSIERELNKIQEQIGPDSTIEKILEETISEPICV